MNWSYKVHAENPDWFNDEIYLILHKEALEARKAQRQAQIKRR